MREPGAETRLVGELNLDGLDRDQAAGRGPAQVHAAHRPRPEAAEQHIGPDPLRVPAAQRLQRVGKITRRGSLVCKTNISEEVRAGEVFIPFVSIGSAAANVLTNDAYDPNGMPEYKICAVRIETA